MEDLYVAVRQKNIADLKDVDAIVLETIGDIIVIPKMPLINAETLSDVKNYPVKIQD